MEGINRFTADKKSDEGEDYVKSLCPLYVGLSIWYNGIYKLLLRFIFWLILKTT